MLGARVFRIFVSSTFQDMRHERDALQECVFDELHTYCAGKGYGFQAIDLRWGIREEASSGQRTMRICLSEIARCREVSPRPNFVVLLGGRYGWRPLPEVVEADEFELVRTKLHPEDAALTDVCYDRDDNAVPAVYTLRSKAAAEADWDEAQARLRPALAAAARQADLDEMRLFKYERSATEQEIIEGAFSAPDAGEHVFCLLRDIPGLPTEAAGYRDLTPDGAPDAEAARLLADLKARLKEHLGANVFEYETSWHDGGLDQDYIERLCTDLLASLKGIIDDEIERLGSYSHLEQERAAHSAFQTERSRCFVGRVEYLEQIALYLQDGPSAPLCVYAEGGLGKSALLAVAAAQARETHPHAAVVVRHVGVTPLSTDPRGLLQDLFAEIGDAYGSSDPAPATLNELQQQLPERLALATADRPLLIFLDSLDQLSGAGSDRISWLPAELPANVRLVTSTRPGAQLADLRDRLPESQFIKLGPMRPEEGCQLLDAWLAEAERRLRPSQRAEVLGRFGACRSPLYLRLAFEQARLWPDDLDDVFLGADVPTIIGDLYDRLEQEHGAEFVGHALGFLACTFERLGLSEEEVLEALADDAEVWREFEAAWGGFAASTDEKRRPERSAGSRRLPVVLWSRLYFDLASYLSPRAAEGSALLTFFHRELADAARERYVKGREAHLHGLIADALGRLARGGDAGEREWRGGAHALSEVPYHLTAAERWDELFAILTDFVYLEEKARRVALVRETGPDGEETTVYNGALVLLDDFDRALSAFPGK